MITFSFYAKAILIGEQLALLYKPHSAVVCDWEIGWNRNNYCPIQLLVSNLKENKWYPAVPAEFNKRDCVKN